MTTTIAIIPQYVQLSPSIILWLKICLTKHILPTCKDEIKKVLYENESLTLDMYNFIRFNYRPPNFSIMYESIDAELARMSSFIFFSNENTTS